MNRDWTMHSSPKPAHPSYRLITALRLFHHLEEADDASGLLRNVPTDSLIRDWRRVIQGEVEKLSEENEYRWRNSITVICQKIILRAAAGKEVVDDLENIRAQERPVWWKWVQTNLRSLWDEESEVARLVLNSVQSGEEF